MAERSMGVTVAEPLTVKNLKEIAGGFAEVPNDAEVTTTRTNVRRGDGNAEITYEARWDPDAVSGRPAGDGDTDA